MSRFISGSPILKMVDVILVVTIASWEGGWTTQGIVIQKSPFNEPVNQQVFLGVTPSDS